MTNSWGIAQELNKPCAGDHSHVSLLNGVAGQAQRYPRKLCEARLQKQKVQDKQGVKTILNIDYGTRQRYNIAGEQKLH